MRAAEMKERPGFSLMKQGDMQTIYHMQMPRWLFSDPRYTDMSLDAKVTYTFLLNRFQLSRRPLPMRPWRKRPRPPAARRPLRRICRPRIRTPPQPSRPQRTRTPGRERRRPPFPNCPLWRRA